MIDTIKIRKFVTDSEIRNMENRIQPCNILKTGDGILKEFFVKNIGIIIRKNLIHISLSLPTMKFGHNLYSLKYGSLLETIQLLEDCIGIDLKDALLGRIDIGQNIIVNHLCNEYFSSLLYLESYHKHEYPSGLNFLSNNNTKKIAFYDKNLQFNKEFVKKRGLAIVPEFFDKNVIRYELRLAHRLNRLLSKDVVFVYDLLDKSIYNNLIKMWISDFLSITKRKNEIQNKARLNASDLKDYLAYIGAEKLGGESYLKQIIEINRKEKSFRNCVQPFRMMKMVNNLYKNGYVCRENELVKELGMKINEAAFMNYC